MDFENWSVIPRFCAEGLKKILDFGLFCSDLVANCMLKKRKILKQSCKDLFIWTELPNVWLIIGSNNIFNIDPLAIDVIVHNSITQNWNTLTSYVDIYFLMT